MDLKAYNKLCSEAEEALAERRLSDALALTEGILKDLPLPDTEDVEEVRKLYRNFLSENLGAAATEQRDQTLNDLFQQAIDTLQYARYRWQTEHKKTLYGRIGAQISDVMTHDLLDQLHRTTRSHVGEKAYHDALDAAFGLIWCDILMPDDEAGLTQALEKADTFARNTLVGALLLGLLDNFQLTKLQLLLTLGTIAQNDLDKATLLEEGNDARHQMEQDANELLARVAVALTLVYQNYLPFFTYLPDLTAQLHDFFASDTMRPHIPMLLRAIASEALTDRVGKRVDDILPLIKEAFEKQQPHLSGSNDKEDNADNEGEEHDTDEKKNDEEPHMEIRVAKIELKAGKKFFRRMANYAHQVDAMRQNDMDVNHSNFTHLKRFGFFNHPAHWFYPFHTDVPDIQKGVTTKDGKLDKMTLSIMDSNRFCDSDRYSYASMMAFLRRDGRSSISDAMRQQIQEMRDEDDDDDDIFSDDDFFDSSEFRLNPFTSYCQTCYRFFRSAIIQEEYAKPFLPSDDILLPLLPLFDGLFTEFQHIEATITSFLQMGDHEHAILLLNYGTEHFGTTASALALRGYAFMQQQQWRRAIGDFQQSLIMEDDEEVQLHEARCYEALGQWQDALPLLKDEDQRLEGKDADIIEETARCLVQLQQWDDAVQQFFRLEFMGKSLNVARRGIGWCSLHQGKYERAEQYYRKLIDESHKPSWEDRLNLGHALWLQGRTVEALTAYRQFVTTFNRTRKTLRAHFRHWTEAFREDARTLLQPHYDTAHIALMTDAIADKSIH